MLLQSDKSSIDFNTETSLFKIQIGKYNPEQLGYIVVFNEYTKNNPIYRELRLTQISEIEQTDSSISCKLQMTNILPPPMITSEIFDFSFNISTEMGYTELNLNCLTETENNYRFGFVIPFKKDWLKICQFAAEKFNSITPVVNFHKNWDRKWPTETYVSFPSLSIIQSDIFFSIFCPTDYNSQFFFNDDTLRITTTSLASKKLTVILKEHVISIRDAYVECFPRSNFVVNYWKVQINKILSEYNIHITYDKKCEKDHPSKIKFTNLSTDASGKAIYLLATEIEKYSKNELSDLGLKEIIICDDLFLMDEEISGFLYRNSTMFLSYKVDFAFIVTFHHEIFHLIQSSFRKQFDDSKKTIEYWNEHSARSDFNEESAHLYSRMLSDPILIEKECYEHVLTDILVKIVEDIYYKTTKKTLQWRSRKESFELKHHDIDISNIDPKGLRMFNYDILKEKVPSNHISNHVYVLCGIKGSGLNLISKYWDLHKDVKVINSLDDVFKYNNYSKLIYRYFLSDIENTKLLYEALKVKFIVLVRHPSFYVNGENLSIVENWLKVNEYLYNKNNVIFIKYENIILDYVGTIKKIGNELGCETPNITDQADFDRICSCNSFVCQKFYENHLSNNFIKDMDYYE